MIPITGYKQVNYSDFQDALKEAYEKKKTNIPQVAVDIKVKSGETVKNAMRQGKQIASDETLTKVMKAVGLAGCVTWVMGRRYYYVKK